ncbi:hypothetical protein [Nocardioides sp.]|uniref:hypothetical protein n=1 Tax=Nocardioides sp. TaxID=35761 RepID=UPI0031FEA5A9|nr:hypothetical protein [Nocardioides sp.]
MNPTLLRSRRPRLAARVGLGLVLALACSVTAGCSSSGDDPGADESSPTAPTGSPFSVDFTGPDTAEPGDTVTATVTNTGRLPDAYQLSVVPVGAASFSKQDLTLAPDESADIKISVDAVPLSIVLKSSGGGVGQEVAQLDIS